MKVTKGSGNVFKDLGLKDPTNESLRSEMALELFKILKKEKLSQTKAASLLGIKQPDLSRLKNGNYSHFSLERILSFIQKFDKKIDIKISKSRTLQSA